MYFLNDTHSWMLFKIFSTCKWIHANMHFLPFIFIGYPTYYVILLHVLESSSFFHNGFDIVDDDEFFHTYMMYCLEYETK